MISEIVPELTNYFKMVLKNVSLNTSICLYLKSTYLIIYTTFSNSCSLHNGLVYTFDKNPITSWNAIYFNFIPVEKWREKEKLHVGKGIYNCTLFLSLERLFEYKRMKIVLTRKK